MIYCPSPPPPKHQALAKVSDDWIAKLDGIFSTQIIFNFSAEFDLNHSLEFFIPKLSSSDFSSVSFLQPIL